MAKAKKSLWAVLVAVVAIVAVIAAFLVFGGTEKAAAKQFATLEVLDGGVNVSKAGGAFQEGADGQSLSAGDVVRTNSEGLAELVYFDESLTRIGPDTEFKLTELVSVDNATDTKRIKGSQGRGRTWNRVTELADTQSRFEIETPVATAAVKGTLFATECDFFGDCTFIAIENVIEVCNALDECVTLEAFAVVLVNADGTFGDVQPFDTLAQLVEAYPWISTNVCDIEEIQECVEPLPPEVDVNEPNPTPLPPPGNSGETPGGSGDTPGGETPGGGPGPTTPPPPPPGPQPNHDPIASFSASTLTGGAPLIVSFIDTSTDPDGDALEHSWSFGDGTSSTQTNPIHIFSLGTWTVTETVTDPSGASDSATRTVTALDLTPPAAPTITDGPDSPTNETDATFTFVAGGGAATTAAVFTAVLAAADDTVGFECRVAPAAFGPCDSPAAFGGLPAGSRLFEVRALDAAGNRSAPTSFNWVIDLTAPTASVDSGPDDPTTSHDATFAVSSNDPTASLTCVLDGGAPADCSDGSISYSDLDVADHTFSVVAQDPAGNTSSPATYSWTVVAPNQAPVCDNDSGTTDEDTQLADSVSCSDPDGGSLTYAEGTGPTNGSLTLNADGTFTYDPDPNFSGSDSFTFTASDGAATSGPATYSITVDPANDGPTCENDSGTTAEDTQLADSVVCTDPDGDSLTYAEGTGPTNGSLTLNADGTFTYDPDPNFSGSDSFTFTASDGELTSDAATYSITVDSVNDGPTCENDSGTTTEDTQLADSVVCTDPDGDSLTYAEGTGPTNGSLTLNADGTFTYDPDPNFSGSDSFTFTASDGAATSGPATYSITVDPANDGPTCENDSGTTAEDTQLADSVVCTDPDGDSLTYAEGTGPTNGSLTLNADGTFTYDPDPNFSGSDSFTFTASDGELTSDAATYSITVDSVNDGPSCENDSGTTAEDTQLADSVVCTDPDGDSLTYAEGTGPANGSLTLNADGTFTYDPDPNFSGSDSFTFTASDGSAASDPATYSITVTAANDGPTCENDSGTTAEDTQLADSVVCTDPDGDSLTYAEGTGPTNGSLTLNADGTFTYDPDPNFSGSDSFTFTASDGELTSDAATYSITVDSVNDGPTCENDSGTTTEDTQLADSVVCTDPDGDSLTYAEGTGPTNGSLTLNADGTFTYDPDPNFSGSDSFTFTASDGSATSDPATYSITVTAANDGPSCSNDSGTTDEDTQLADTVACSDPDGDSLTYAEGTGPANGTLAFNADGTFTYDPDPNFSGSDSFTFTASDGAATSGPATYSITVDPVNDAPVCTSDSGSTNEDTQLTDTVVCTDTEGDSLTYAEASEASNGEVTVNADGTFTYDPDPNFSGSDAFTFTASDGAATSSPATYSITVTAANDGPSCENDSGTTGEDTQLADTVACTDPEGDSLTYAEGTGPANGSLTLNADGTFTYDPDPNFSGSDSFTFTASDGSATSDPATYSITVTAANDGPSCSNDSGTTDEDTQLADTVACSDPDGDSLTYAEGTGPANGTLAFNSDGTFTYDPDPNFSGSDAFTFTASDGELTSDAATYSITVDSVNDGPSCENDSGTTDEDTQLADTVACSDPDGDSLTYAEGTGPANGTLAFNSDGTFTYDPDPNFSGSDSFTFTASDGSAASDPATYSITVTADEEATLTVNKSGTGTGSVSGDGITCGGDCTETAEVGTVFVLSATADSGSSFDGWSGCDSVDGNSCTVTLASGGTTVTASFLEETNFAPQCENIEDSVRNTQPNVTIQVGRACSDPNEDDTLSILSFTEPENGDVIVQAGGSMNIKYNPDDCFVGTDVFTVTVTDGELSTTLTVSIQVTGESCETASTSLAITSEEPRPRRSSDPSPTRRERTRETRTTDTTRERDTRDRTRERDGTHFGR